MTARRRDSSPSISQPSSNVITIRRSNTSALHSFPHSLFGPPTARSRSALSSAISSKPEAQFEEGEEKGGDEFVYSQGLSTSEATNLLNIHGRNELPEKKISLCYVFLSLLWQPMPIMIWIAAIVEGAIQNYPDMGILLFILFANASIGFYETVKAGDAVAALKSQLQAKATVKRDGAWKHIDAAFVVPGDLLLLAAGSAIPADCRVNDGEIEVDQAALTGESLSVTMFKGDCCRMGSIVVQGEVEATVEFTGKETFFGATAALLAPKSEYSNFTKVLVRIVLILVLSSSILCIIVFVYVLLQTSVIDALSFAIVLLVASVPLAIEIVTTTTLALGSKQMSYHGAIVTRLSAIEDMAGMAILCSDKTGTLTLNKMVIQDEIPIYAAGETRESLLAHAAMATKWKEPAKDALDKLVLSAVDFSLLSNVEMVEYTPFNPSTKYTKSSIRETLADGTIRTYHVAKGAPHAILAVFEESAYTSETEGTYAQTISLKVEQDLFTFGTRGIRCLAVAKTNEQDEWQMLGMLTFLDPPRPDTKATIEAANEYGVAVKMITGDHLLIACETAQCLGLGPRIFNAGALPLLDPDTKEKPANLARDFGDMCLAADGFAEVFPEHKYLIVECLRELGYKVGMTGDGVNDAPALKRADVGIAVSGATDAARAAADIILTAPGLSTIIDGIYSARSIFCRIRNFFIYRIAATMQLLIFFFVAVFAFKPIDYFQDSFGSYGFPSNEEQWPPFFHMPVLMLMLITLLNDGTLITIAYDNASPSLTPEKWNIPLLFFIGAVLSGVASLSSLLLLYLLLTSWKPDGAFQRIGIGGVNYGQITTAVYLKISVSDFLTLFSARAGERWFLETRPAGILIAGGIFALSCSTILACAWPKSYPDKIYTLGLSRSPPLALPVYIWLYCLIWWIIQEAAKVLSFRIVRRFNLFHINESGKLEMSDSTVHRPSGVL